MILTHKSDVIFFDGDFRAWDESVLHITSHSLHYASAVYEGIRCNNGVLFYPKLHIERLKQSMNLLGLSLEYDLDQLIPQLSELITVNKFQELAEVYIRVIVWCGNNKMTVNNLGVDIHIAAFAWPRPRPDPTPRRLSIGKWQRFDPNSFPIHAKSAGLYTSSALNIVQAQKQGFNDALMLDSRGYISEATSSHFFALIDGKLHTPTTFSCIEGITRKMVIEKIAPQLGLKLYERDIGLRELSAAEACFLTGTAVGILPVASVTTQEQEYLFLNQRFALDILDEYLRLKSSE